MRAHAVHLPILVDPTLDSTLQAQIVAQMRALIEHHLLPPGAPVDVSFEQPVIRASDASKGRARCRSFMVGPAQWVSC